PVEYADFEGLIPEDNYGAGAMIVWDRGTWHPIEDPAHGIDKGKLLFELRGYRLRGVWTLVKTKGKPNDWLLIKHKDQYCAHEGSRPLAEESSLSGLTIADLEEKKDRGHEIIHDLEALSAPKKRVRPVDVKVMLADTSEHPFSRKGWIFELKYDGYRLVAAKD